MELGSENKDMVDNKTFDMTKKLRQQLNLNDIHRKITNRLTTTIRRRISSISELGFNSNKNIWY